MPDTPVKPHLPSGLYTLLSAKGLTDALFQVEADRSSYSTTDINRTISQDEERFLQDTILYSGMRIAEILGSAPHLDKVEALKIWFFKNLRVEIVRINPFTVYTLSELALLKDRVFAYLAVVLMHKISMPIPPPITFVLRKMSFSDPLTSFTSLDLGSAGNRFRNWRPYIPHNNSWWSYPCNVSDLSAPSAPSAQGRRTFSLNNCIPGHQSHLENMQAFYDRREEVEKYIRSWHAVTYMAFGDEPDEQHMCVDPKVLTLPPFPSPASHDSLAHGSQSKLHGGEIPSNSSLDRPKSSFSTGVPAFNGQPSQSSATNLRASNGLTQPRPPTMPMPSLNSAFTTELRSQAMASRTAVPNSANIPTASQSLSGWTLKVAEGPQASASGGNCGPVTDTANTYKNVQTVHHAPYLPYLNHAEAYPTLGAGQSSGHTFTGYESSCRSSVATVAKVGDRGIVFGDPRDPRRGFSLAPPPIGSGALTLQTGRTEPMARVPPQDPNQRQSSFSSAGCVGSNSHATAPQALSSQILTASETLFAPDSQDAQNDRNDRNDSCYQSLYHDHAASGKTPSPNSFMDRALQPPQVDERPVTDGVRLSDAQGVHQKSGSVSGERGAGDTVTFTMPTYTRTLTSDAGAAGDAEQTQEHLQRNKPHNPSDKASEEALRISLTKPRDQSAVKDNKRKLSQEDRDMHDMISQKRIALAPVKSSSYLREWPTFSTNK
ncbi:hypothetical protein CVT24_001092 [Panaeolus cyanescens]|uniref:Uncharacterized protein n=1 Tax=Panaeolus cyanescens TaxID=181874 RepID=A0A409YTM4_9AGAR|nr:hypothetical protein CVT24_001092 [Panaeolus cyanescens]